VKDVEIYVRARYYLLSSRLTQNDKSHKIKSLDEGALRLTKEKWKMVVNKSWLRYGLLFCGLLLAGTAQADFPSVPKETYEALKLDRSASPKELHEALVKRYLDPAEGFGKGKYGQYWEPIPFSKTRSASSPPKMIPTTRKRSWKRLRGTCARWANSAQKSN
jgi:hypothetical protein